MAIIHTENIMIPTQVEMHDERVLTVLTDPPRNNICPRQEMEGLIEKLSYALKYISDRDIRDFNDRTLLQNDPVAFLKENDDQHPLWQEWTKEHPEEAVTLLSKIHLNHRSREGFVYIVQGDQYFKIGCTNNIKKRMHALGVKSPFPLQTHIVIPSDNIEFLEQQLHKRFAAKHVRGEWFSLSQEDLVAISHEYSTIDPMKLRMD